MTFANVLIYVALIIYILVGKAKGKPIGTPKKLLALPIVLIVLGYGDLTHGGLKPVDVAFTGIGAFLSLGLGAWRGLADKLSDRDGAPFVQWGIASFALFGLNIVGKLVIDVIAVAEGGTTTAIGKSLVVTIGLTLLGEALVLVMRDGSIEGLRLPPAFRQRQL